MTRIHLRSQTLSPLTPPILLSIILISTVALRRMCAIMVLWLIRTSVVSLSDLYFLILLTLDYSTPLLLYISLTSYIPHLTYTSTEPRWRELLARSRDLAYISREEIYIHQLALSLWLCSLELWGAATTAPTATLAHQYLYYLCRLTDIISPPLSLSRKHILS